MRCKIEEAANLMWHNINKSTKSQKFQLYGIYRLQLSQLKSVYIMLMTVGLVGDLFFFFEKLVGNLRHLDSNSKPFI